MTYAENYNGFEEMYTIINEQGLSGVGDVK
jgi:hypothetical protein